MIVALIVIMIIFGIAATTLVSVAAETRAAGAARDDLQALWIAETGLNLALVEMAREVDAGGDGLGTVSGSFGGGTYSVTATPSGSETVLVSLGTLGRQRRRAEATIEKDVVRLFPRALTAGRRVILENYAFVDSYNGSVNSGPGSYASQTAGTHAGMPRAGSAGHARGDYEIRAEDSSGIYGDATPGVAGTVTEDPGAVITGSTAPDGTTPEAPPLPYVPDFTSSGPLFVGGASVTEIGPGDLSYQEVSVFDDGRLTITGPARVYVEEDFTLSDLGPGSPMLEVDATVGPVEIVIRGIYRSDSGTSHASTTGRAQDLSITILGATLSSYHDASGPFYGTFYAPGSTLGVGGYAEVHGAVTARTIWLHDHGRVHYDTTLATHTTLVEWFRVIVWKELPPGA